MEAVSQFREPVTPLRRRVEPLDNLPLQLTRFIGRERELARLRELLGNERLVTLTGTGGIGKTRLALEVAEQLKGSYPDGVWLVDLAPLAQAALVAQEVAETLGVRAETEMSVHQALLEFLQNRQLLLVLDNCEHLIEACATLADAVLQTGVDVRILATSREPLHIAGETAWRVPTLPMPAAAALFADRAAASSGFIVTNESEPVVVRLCQQLDGIPLAIELAAARSGFLSPDEIAKRLDNRLRLLVGGRRTAPARQQTLRAAIDWSYELLSDAERRLLRGLSVFAGGWTLEAAEQVCDAEPTSPDGVFELLAKLVDKSLVQAEPGPAGQTRYRLLETVRQYAFEALEHSGDMHEMQQRHCSYCSKLASEAEAHVLWGAGGFEWVTGLDQEQANLRAAMAWSLSGSGAPSAGLAMAISLGHYWYTRGDRAEGRTWLRRALEEATPDQSEPTSAWALLWAGGLAHGQSDYDEATALVGRAMDAFEQLQDRRGIGWGYHFLGHIARARSDLARAAEFLERSIAAFRDVGDELSAILPMAALGFTTCLLGDQTLATQLLQESVRLARQTGSTGRLAIALIYQGQVMGACGETRAAGDALEEGLKLSREWDSAWGMAECLEGLAVVASADGLHERAARLLGAAARLRKTIGAPAHPVDRADHERAVASSQSALGGGGYAIAWAAGQAMTVDEVIAYAAKPETPTEIASRLTARERQVVALIAKGASNRDIAERLVISERTVTNHVEHIFDKLGFRSRTQVAAWFFEHNNRQ